MVKELENKINQSINEFQRQSKTKWLSPVLGFADARSLNFTGLKKTAGEQHLFPHDLLAKAKSVIAYFIPFSPEVARSNDYMGPASKEWAIAYIETNALIMEINEKLMDYFKKQGIQSAIIPPTHNFDTKTLLSGWSHRHIAEICGLGSFGLNNMLITEKGCAGRLGSLVTALEIIPSQPYKTENCLYKLNGSCGLCLKKCNAGALETNSFDRQRCYSVCLENAALYKDLGIADVCGKCLCGLPCSQKNPVV